MFFKHLVVAISAKRFKFQATPLIKETFFKASENFKEVNASKKKERKVSSLKGDEWK